MPFDKEKVQKAIRMLLEGLGEDLDSESLAETPERVADAYEEILRGKWEDPKDVVEVFEEEDYDEIVLVKDIPFYSMCEHHLLPFHGQAHVAYVPRGNRITGISKLARLVEIHARRLQVQERMTTDIADSLVEALDPKGVAVVVNAEHLCMTMRGVRKPGSKTVTSVVRGLFRENAAARSEAMALIDAGRTE
ncbi:MAG: GTP cyclohydrolase I FolE [Planctomycetota bacterium]